jgi:hypothetical protein
VTGERAYARAIEAAWARMKGRPVVLSPREFELVSSWRRDGIPLRVVLEVLGEEARLAGGRREPRSLGFLAAAVREAGQVVAQGRAATGTSPTSSPSAVDLWRRALGAMPAQAPLHAAIARLLEAASEGVAPEELDRRLDEELTLCAPSDRLAAVSEASRAALAPFRGRMSREEHERALRRAIVDRLREELELPRAALSHSSKIG